jgi:hypothetical protein
MTRGGGTHEEASVRTTLEGKPVRQDGGAGGAARIHIFVALTRPNRFRERVSWDSTAGAVPHFGVWEGPAGAGAGASAGALPMRPYIAQQPRSYVCHMHPSIKVYFYVKKQKFEVGVVYTNTPPSIFANNPSHHPSPHGPT